MSYCLNLQPWVDALFCNSHFSGFNLARTLCPSDIYLNRYHITLNLPNKISFAVHVVNNSVQSQSADVAGCISPTASPFTAN